MRGHVQIPEFLDEASRVIASVCADGDTRASARNVRQHFYGGIALGSPGCGCQADIDHQPVSVLRQYVAQISQSCL